MIENVKKDKMIPLLAATIGLHWLLTALGYRPQASHKGSEMVCWRLTQATQVHSGEHQGALLHSNRL